MISSDKISLVLGNGFNSALDVMLREKGKSELGLSYPDLFAEILGILEQNNEQHNRLKLIMSSYYVQQKLKDKDVDLEDLYGIIKSEDLQKIHLQLVKKAFLTKHSKIYGRIFDVESKAQKTLNDCVKSSPVHYETSAKNLKSANIFTLNYDLVLVYKLWQDGSFKDGFPKKKADDDIGMYGDSYIPDINFFYLHGALHIFHCNGTSGKFFTKPGETLQKLVEKVHEYIKKRGEASKIEDSIIFLKQGKEDAIKSVDFLQNGFTKLTNLDGTLIIYGCGMKQNDDHIWKNIMNSKLSKVYVGVNPEDGQKIKNYLLGLKDSNNSTKVLLYNQKSHNIWQDTNWAKNLIAASK